MFYLRGICYNSCMSMFQDSVKNVISVLKNVRCHNYCWSLCQELSGTAYCIFSILAHVFASIVLVLYSLVVDKIPYYGCCMFMNFNMLICIFRLVSHI